MLTILRLTPSATCMRRPHEASHTVHLHTMLIVYATVAEPTCGTGFTIRMAMGPREARLSFQELTRRVPCVMSTTTTSIVLTSSCRSMDCRVGIRGIRRWTTSCSIFELRELVLSLPNSCVGVPIRLMVIEVVQELSIC